MKNKLKSIIWFSSVYFLLLKIHTVSCYSCFFYQLWRSNPSQGRNLDEMFVFLSAIHSHCVIEMKNFDIYWKKPKSYVYIWLFDDSFKAKSILNWIYSSFVYSNLVLDQSKSKSIQKIKQSVLTLASFVWQLKFILTMKRFDMFECETTTWPDW